MIAGKNAHYAVLLTRITANILTNSQINFGNWFLPPKVSLYYNFIQYEPILYAYWSETVHLRARTAINRNLPRLNRLVLFKIRQKDLKWVEKQFDIHIDQFSQIFWLEPPLTATNRDWTAWFYLKIRQKDFKWVEKQFDIHIDPFLRIFGLEPA